jgi:serine/threonine protein kinase
LKIRWTDDFPILAKNLVGKILKLKPAERPSLEEIINHPWFKETPIIKPVLLAIDYDPASKLRSHIVQFVPEEEGKVTDSVKSVLLKKRESIKKYDESEVLISNSNKAENESLFLRAEIDSKNEEIKSFREELNKKDRIISELKSKIDKISNDETTLKIRDQEKISFINELEIKTKNLMEIENRYKLLKSEFSQLEKRFLSLKENNEEVYLKNIEYEKTVSDLTYKLNKLDQEKQQEIMNLEMKLRIAEVNFVMEGNSNEKDSSGYDPDKILVMTKEYLAELVDLLRNKFFRIEDKIVQQEKGEAEFRENLTSRIDSKVGDMISNFKETYTRISAEEKSLVKKQLEEGKNISYNKSIEWYKQQITELSTFKQKYSQDVYLVAKMKDEMIALTHSRDVLIEKNSYLDGLVKSQYELLSKFKNAKQKYKNAFIEADNLFCKFVKNKNLRELINFKDNFSDS